MKETEQSMLNDLQYYFVVEQPTSDGNVELSLSSYAPFRDDRSAIPFDSEMDAALYFLEKFRNGAIVSSNDVETAKAIIRGDQPMFLFEEKQLDGTLLLSLHNHLPSEGSSAVVFGSRSARLVARLLLRRLHETKRVWATEETIRQAQTLIDQG